MLILKRYNNYKFLEGYILVMNNQVKCKTRVADHGEVFTVQREVNTMLDLVLKKYNCILETLLIKEKK